MPYMFCLYLMASTYDHRVWKTGLPVRSAVLKPHAGELVVGWVTTSESSLLYVFGFSFFFFWISYTQEIKSFQGCEREPAETSVFQGCVDDQFG